MTAWEETSANEHISDRRKRLQVPSMPFPTLCKYAMFSIRKFKDLAYNMRHDLDHPINWVKIDPDGDGMITLEELTVYFKENGYTVEELEDFTGWFTPSHMEGAKRRAIAESMMRNRDMDKEIARQRTVAEREVRKEVSRQSADKQKVE